MLRKSLKKGFIFLVVFLLFIFAIPIQTHIKTILFLTREFPLSPVQPLIWLTPKPEYKRIEIKVQDEKIIADLVMSPNAEKNPAVILAMGVRTQAKDKPLILNFADTLARLGYIVFWPRSETLEKGVPSFENPYVFVKSFQYLESLEQIDTTRISFIGFSVGSSIAIVAASDPSIAKKVRAVVFFGGYFNIQEYLSALTESVEGKKAGWVPSQGAVEHFQEILKQNNADFSSYKQMKILTKINPAENIDNFKSKVFILHGRNDNYVPYTESYKLYEALGQNRIGAFTLVDLFEHVQPKKTISWQTLLEFRKIYWFVYKVLHYI